mmetsp:Transcript_122719/g.192636  ORF Transcript_122719/g.192636 Transcript_122719/m.192636 type:complete len:106 (-) Transcript_122719:291-608(-)
MVPTSHTANSVAELLAVWRWSTTVLQSRFVRWWVGDVTLPTLCHVQNYLFQPAKLPTPFVPAQRYLPQICNCTGPVGCKFPRGGPSSGARLEFGRIPVHVDKRNR